MKNLKRVMALLMAASMTAGLAACGSKGDSGESGSKSSEKNSGASESATDEFVERTDPATGKPYDLGGMEVIIRDWWTDPSQQAAEKTAYDEARAEYLELIQKTYNFKLHRMAISDWGTTPQDFIDYVTNDGPESDADEDGKNDYYVFVLRQCAEMSAAMDSKLMYDVNKLDCLDLKNSKWDTTIFDMTKNSDGEQCCFRAEEHEARLGCYFNKRLVQEAGIDPEDIYKWQKDGSWTWDKFEECMKACTKDTDGDGINNTWGMVCFGSRFYPGCVYSNDAMFIGKKDGKYYNALESDETLAALNWGLKMLNNYNRPALEGENWDYFNAAFINGEAAFFPGEEVYLAGSLKNGNGKAEDEEGYQAGMADEFGFVCFPKGPNAKDYTDYNGDNLYAIPACYSEEDAWKVAFVYDLYTDPVPGFANYEAWKSDLMDGFCDTKSVLETIPYLKAKSQPVYQSFITGIDMGAGLLWAINDENTPAQQAEAIRETWQEQIDIANGDKQAE